MANSSTSNNIVKTAIDNLLADLEKQFKKAPGIGSVTDSNIFRQITPSSGAFIEAPWGGGGYFKLSGEEQNPVSTQRSSGSAVTYTLKDYTQAESIPDDFASDSSQHYAVAKLLRDMRDTAIKSMELYGFECFRNAFSGATTYDGVAIFSASHVNVDGSTLSNLITPALDDAAVETGITSLLEMNNQDSVLGMYVPSVLFVPPVLFKEACILTESQLRPETSDNDYNWVSSKYPGLKVMQSPFIGSAIKANAGQMITAGSDSRWFLLSDQTPFLRVEKEGLNMLTVDSSVRDNFVSLVKAKFRQETGCTVPNGILGSNSTT